MRFIKYVVAGGRIIMEGQMSDPADLPLQPVGAGEAIMESDVGTMSGHYIEGGEVLERQPLPAVVSKTSIAPDDSDEAVISGLPDPCTLVIDGVPAAVTGGSLTLTASQPATYDVRSYSWPYLDWSVNITAEEQDAPVAE